MSEHIVSILGFSLFGIGFIYQYHQLASKKLTSPYMIFGILTFTGAVNHLFMAIGLFNEFIVRLSISTPVALIITGLTWIVFDYYYKAKRVKECPHQ